jgi:hypothetical protein
MDKAKLMIISNNPVGDSKHVMLMSELKVLNEALKVALSNLIAARRANHDWGNGKS